MHLYSKCYTKITTQKSIKVLVTEYLIQKKDTHSKVKCEKKKFDCGTIKNRETVLLTQHFTQIWTLIYFVLLQLQNRNLVMILNKL